MGKVVVALTTKIRASRVYSQTIRGECQNCPQALLTIHHFTNRGLG
ncbi:hypothetical protein EBBID32_38200 [Sphingobium indicum BiD32]|uniref:Uncharacterized protein n=1 Tax=Sphingobium indicum BiD32 TaxID=1301087 RepID=N1MRT7_9SPHN|nr:hypothetical protein EBBID32_38200 [Sphingobium indicum BiD32]